MKPIELPELHVPADHPLLKKRNLTVKAMSVYQLGFDDEGNLWAPHYVDSVPVLAKVRTAGKKFWTEGNDNAKHVGLWGKHACHSKRNLIIVEGELDAVAAYQLMDGRMNVVSVPFGVNRAEEDVKRDLEWIESHEKVFVLMDMDEPGRECQKKLVDLLADGKAYDVHLPLGFKDPCDVLMDGDAETFRKAIYGAQPVVPSGFVSPEELAARSVEFFMDRSKRVGISTGIEGLDDMFGGFRPGEVFTFVSGTGVGKSTVMRQLLFNLRRENTKSLYIPMEDMTEVATIQLAQLELNRQLLRDEQYDNADELRGAMLRVLEYVTILDRWDYQKPEEVLRKIEYGARIHGAKVVALDHITWLAEGGAIDADSRKVTEFLMPRLKELAQKWGLTILVISHLSRDKSDKDDTEPSISRIKNSTAIQQVSDCIIGVVGNRDENKVELRALKQNRLWGRSNVTNVELIYDPDTTHLHEPHVEDFCPDMDELDNVPPWGVDNTNDDTVKSNGKTKKEEATDDGEAEGVVQEQVRSERVRDEQPEEDSVRSDEADVQPDEYVHTGRTSSRRKSRRNQGTVHSDRPTQDEGGEGAASWVRNPTALSKWHEAVDESA